MTTKTTSAQNREWSDLAVFKKGQKVSLLLIGGGFVTKERKTVLRVDTRGVWLDNGAGNNPSGPFDAMTGERDPLMPGWSQRIEARTTPIKGSTP